MPLLDRYVQLHLRVNGAANLDRARLREGIGRVGARLLGAEVEVVAVGARMHVVRDVVLVHELDAVADLDRDVLLGELLALLGDDDLGEGVRRIADALGG